MPNRDGIVSIGFDYKKDLEKMIKDFEAEMNAVSSNTQLSKGMKKQFDNILAEMRDFKASIDKELVNLGSGKVSQSSFKSFKQAVENKFKGIREDIDRLDLAVATLNDSMGILGKGVDLSKIFNDFKSFEDYVTRTNSAVENLIHTLGEQGVSLFSFDNRNISDVQSTIRKIDNELKQLDKDTGAEFELFNEKQAQDELNRLSVQLTSTLELMENAKKQMETMDTSTEGFKKVRGEFALLQLKAASLNDTIEMLYEVTESKDMYIEMDDKSLSMYEKYTDELADNLETITSYAKNAKKELSSLLDTQKSPAIKVSSEMNPNSSELATVVTIETTSSELWKKLSPIMEDLQKTLNSNPVVAPVKLVVAPTSVSSAETGNLDVSKGYSKKYQKILAQTGEDAVVDLEGVYKKTFTSVMDTATSYAKETIGKIQEIFDKNLIGVKFDISQEEIDKIQNFVLSNKDGKKVDISGQITKAKQEVEELNESIEKTAKLLDDTKSKGNVKFDGFDKFTQDVSKSIGKLEELQNILKALQNIEITLAKASGIASITELDNQWANVEKRILNATKLDGSFRKNASVSKIASEYQKYIDMGGTNSITDIDKIKDNKDTLDAIISKAKEFAKQDLSNDSVKELSIELDGIISKFDELISTVKTATNALYKIIKQTGVSELDKQWSSITNKFKSIADESGKINLSKQRKDVEELLVMYQRYVNMGGSHTPFDLTDNLETVSKLDKAYKKLNEIKPIDNSSTIKSETESFKQVEQSVNSLTKAIGDTKVQAINIEATAMEDAAEREILAINAIVDSLDVVVKRLKDIKGIKPKIEIKETTSPVETNISSSIKDTFQGDKIEKATTSAKELDKTLEQAVDVPTDKFDEILSKLDLTESKLGKIVRITKQLHIDENGKPVESYTLKDKYGSTEIYGESSNKATKQLLSANYVEYDSKQAEKEAKELLAVEKEITKEIEKQEKAQSSAQKKKWQAFENEQKKYVSDQKKTTDIEKNKSAYQELLDTIKQYSEVSKRIAKNETLDGDLELAQKFENKISELQKNPILSSSQIAKSERDLVNLFNQLDTLEKKVTKQQATKIVENSTREIQNKYKEIMELIQIIIKAEDAIDNLNARKIKNPLLVNDSELKKQSQIISDAYEKLNKLNHNAFMYKNKKSGLITQKQYDEYASAYSSRGGTLDRTSDAQKTMKNKADVQEAKQRAKNAEALEKERKALRELSAEKQKLQEKDRQSSVDTALKDQLSAWKDIQNIREKIAKTTNEEELSILNQQKKNAQQQYLSAEKVLKANVALYDNEARLSKMEKIRLETNRKLAVYTKQQTKIEEKNQSEAWDKNVKAIQEYMDANTKLNKLKAQDVGTGKKASEIAYQTKEVEKLEKAALEARATLSSMINPHEVPIDDWNKWLEMMKQFDQATEGSARSVARLEDALRNMKKAQLDSAQSKIDSYIKKLNPYTDTTKYTSEFISRVDSAQSEIKNIDVASPEGLARLKEIESIVNEIIKDSNLLENKLVKQDSKIADIISKMKIFRDSNTNMSKSQRADLQVLIDSAEAMAKTGKVTAEAIEQIKIGFSGIKAEVTATGNTGLKMIDRIVQRAEDMNAKFIAQFFSWQDWLRYLREGFTIINEIDKSITELRKVSNGTASDLKHALNSATEDAKELGTSISNIVSMQSDWARLGYSIPESEELARVTQLYVNVGDNMSAETASENLISTLQGFQLEADEAENIVSAFNEVANNFAIDTQGIGEALKRSAASFNAANTDLSKSIALITATRLQNWLNTWKHVLRIYLIAIEVFITMHHNIGETTI